MTLPWVRSTFTCPTTKVYQATRTSLAKVSKFYTPEHPLVLVWASPIDFTYYGRGERKSRHFPGIKERISSFQDYEVRIWRDSAGTLEVNVSLSGIPSAPSFSFNPLIQSPP
jgi:hypothetical protein